MPAVRTSGRVLLKVRNGVTDARNRTALRRAGSVAMTVSAVCDCRPRGNGGLVIRQRQFRDRPVYFFFDLLEQAGDGQVRLLDAVGFPKFRDKLQRHPAKHVINDGRSVANVRVLREAGRLEALMREFLYQRFKRHAILQRHAGQGADAIHQAANRGTFLRHGDEQFAGPAVLEQADREVAFVAGNVELVGDGGARFGQTPAQRRNHLRAQSGDFALQFLDAAGDIGLVAAFAGFPGVERL